MEIQVSREGTELCIRTNITATVQHCVSLITLLMPISETHTMGPPLVPAHLNALVTVLARRCTRTACVYEDEKLRTENVPSVSSAVDN